MAGKICSAKRETGENHGGREKGMKRRRMRRWGGGGG